MHLQRHASHFQLLTKRATGPSLVHLATNLSCSRRYNSTSPSSPERIAVLGGGISGLASAYFVTKEFPDTKVVLYESGKELGGWIKSERVDVNNGNVLFEYGPRTLRPGPWSLPTAQVIHDLGLTDNVLYTKKDSVGARNRYIYYPDRLNHMPAIGALSLSQLFALWQSGVLSGLSRAILEPIVPQRSSRKVDESVGSFFSRRIDKRLVENIISAVFHGIYAGDVWQLSAKTLLSQAWQLEGRYGGIFKGLYWMNIEGQGQEQCMLWHPSDLDTMQALRDDIDIDKSFFEKLMSCSVFSFRNGLKELVNRLVETLEANENVEIRRESNVEECKMVSGEQKVEVITQSEPTTPYDLVISSLRTPDLTPYVTVMTVNLYYPTPNLSPVNGFGYLIPQSIPFEQNPERALGVIFDSDTVTGQDTAAGTKLTVMLGGHWWDGWAELPSEAEGVEMAKSVIRRHLGITDEPIATRAGTWTDCIPQYTVGYEERLKEHSIKAKEKFRGRMRFVGNQYHGVGVNDCIKSAWSIARGLRGAGWRERKTGLERAEDERKWVLAPIR